LYVANDWKQKETTSCWHPSFSSFIVPTLFYRSHALSGNDPCKVLLEANEGCPVAELRSEPCTRHYSKPSFKPAIIMR